MIPNINSLILQSLYGIQPGGLPGGLPGMDNPLFQNIPNQMGGRGAPAVAPPIPQPGNLSNIYAQAGPFMQQALGLAGQSRPVSGPPPQPGMPWSPPSPAHIAPRQPGQFQISPIELMNRKWLSALNGR